MTEKVRCSRCDAEYTDQDSIQMVKKWLEDDGYAPCPNISCPGQLAIVGGSFEVVDMYCTKCRKKVESPSSFRTPEHLRVYMTTGVCQTCQDLEARKQATLERIRGR